MLDEASLGEARAWMDCARDVLGNFAPGVNFHVEALPGTGAVEWITHLVDRIEPTTRLVIAAQFWAEKEEEREFSEGAAAFLVEPDAPTGGAILRPMISSNAALNLGLSQIYEYQMSRDQHRQIWFTGGHDDESTAIRMGLPLDSTDMPPDRLLDTPLGNPGPSSGWIALAIAMEAMREAGPQLIGWREPNSESLYLCTVSPLPQEETES
ncbi:hypothetical protein [Paraburkholderia unamae]|uniref:hypothetical protein n=1 Tax=Paraburkholderia unamae TaxID=219649 RepID=UPI000DD2F757|nr:hypothetical protein [Paraburkholderia unamae]